MSERDLNIEKMWFVRGEHEDLGPLDAKGLRKLVLQQKLQRHDEVRRGSSGSWLKAGKVRGLFSATHPVEVLSSSADWNESLVAGRGRRMGVRQLIFGVIGVLAATAVLFLYKGSGGSAPDAGPQTAADKYLAEGEVLIRSKDSLVRGIVSLELAFGLDPDLPGLRDSISRAARVGVEQLVGQKQFREAVQLARRIHGTIPSEESATLVGNAELAADVWLKKELEILSPKEHVILESAEVLVRGQLTSSPFFGEVLVGGQRVQVIGSAFEHLVTGLAEGPQQVVVEVVDAEGFGLPFAIDVVVDTQAPRLRLEVPGDNAVVKGRFVARGAVQDATATTVVFCGKSVPVAADGTWDMELELGDGFHEELLVVTDAIGRSTSRLVSLMVDAQVPVFNDLDQGSRERLDDDEWVTRIVLGPGDDVTQVRVEDSFLKEVVFNGRRVSFDDEGTVYLATSSGEDEEDWTSYELIATDEAGNKMREVIEVRRDKTAPDIRSVAKQVDVFPGSNYVLEGEIVDRSLCSFSLLRGDPVTIGTARFAFPYAVPKSSFVGTDIRLAFVVRDLAGNKAEGLTVLTVVEPCPTCVAEGDARGKCKECGGSAVVGEPCTNRHCDEGQSTETCGLCGGSGKAPCGVCNGAGVLEPQVCTVCAGDYRKECPTCEGKGRYRDTCVRCKGSGWYRVTFGLRPTLKCPTKMWRTCRTCDGSKKVICASCTRGKVKPGCSNCVNGWLNEVCVLCKGKRKITQPCDKCDGKGARSKKCKTCSGSGLCPTCGGSGRADSAQEPEPLPVPGAGVKGALGD